MTEDEMVGWHHWLNGHEFEQILGDGERQGSLVCCSPWGCKVLDTTKRLNNDSKYSYTPDPISISHVLSDYSTCCTICRPLSCLYVTR